MQQQILDLFEFKPSFNNFIPISNEIICASLQSFSSQYTHLVGSTKTGKTHLLNAWVNLALDEYKSAIYINCIDTNSTMRIQEINLKNERFIAIDNVECLDNDGQIDVFNLFNHIKLNNLDNYLLTSSSEPLHTLNLRDDLTTRLLSGINFQLKHLTDDELITALGIYVKKEGINFSQNELNYLITHHERNIGKLIKIINKIANHALTHKKNISTTLIKHLTGCAS